MFSIYLKILQIFRLDEIASEKHKLSYTATDKKNKVAFESFISGKLAPAYYLGGLLLDKIYLCFVKGGRYCPVSNCFFPFS